ncbi:protein ImuB [Sphingomonas metalli]|uniref:Protein ImuB n=1 Tax=Sphingomonas metalli TaxID=1779358 RepID=A0A916WRQ4_9SPHN|nr:DNA polymerase Y family protein [Sphingomonas metalli]GGB23324.1 protein ImuB [Sphingomonas metalli]
MPDSAATLATPRRIAAARPSALPGPARARSRPGAPGAGLADGATGAAPGARRARRYLALVFPWLPIERLRGTRPHLFVAPDAPPVVLVERMGRAARIAACDPAAVRAGVSPGMTLAAAQARLPGCVAYDHDPAADCDWLDRLADACCRYTPRVAAEPPDALLLDIADTAEARAAEQELADDIERRLARRGIAVRLAFGDTPAIAAALARHAGAPAPDERGAVRRLPLAALGLDAEATEGLAQAGHRTVGELLALPAAAVAARFGREAAAAVRRLAEEAGPPIRPRTPIAALTVERHLTRPAARAADALAALALLTDEAAADLTARGQGGRRWDASFYRTDGTLDRLRVKTDRPTRDGVALLGLFRAQRGGLAEAPDDGAGVDLLRLDVSLVERLDAGELRLEGGSTAAPAPALPRPAPIRRRRAGRRDDPGQVQVPLLLADAPPPARIAAPGEAAAPPRPIHLFDPPEPIVAVSPSGEADLPPGRFRWRGVLHHVARVEGPERIADDRRPGGRSAPAPRDYYRVEDRRGRRLWLFRQALAEPAGEARWYVHGLFA